jgi:hypothetical protein
MSLKRLGIEGGCKRHPQPEDAPRMQGHASQRVFQRPTMPRTGDIAAEYSDEGTVAAVGLWIPRPTSRRAATSVVWRGGGTVFGICWSGGSIAKIRWR